MHTRYMRGSRIRYRTSRDFSDPKLYEEAFDDKNECKILLIVRLHTTDNKETHALLHSFITCLYIVFWRHVSEEIRVFRSSLFSQTTLL
jgi:hypothetical protein